MNHPQQQPGIPIEIELHRRLALSQANNNIGLAITYLLGVVIELQFRKFMLQLRRIEGFGIQLGGLLICRRHLTQRPPGK